jgi:threonine/homoserine/homoserine lactone efflux protein
MNAPAIDAPLLQLALLAVSSSLSPGPNNLLIAAHGACFGVRRSLPTLLGMYAGFGGIFAVVALSASFVSRALPGLLPALQVAGVAYLLWLAWRLLQAQWSDRTAAAPLGFLRGALLQAVNPKLWLMTLATVALCARPGPDGGEVSLPLVGFFVALTVPSMLAYLHGGSALRALARSPAAQRRTRRALAALTAASALTLLVDA